METWKLQNNIHKFSNALPKGQSAFSYNKAVILVTNSPGWPQLTFILRASIHCLSPTHSLIHVLSLVSPCIFIFRSFFQTSDRWCVTNSIKVYLGWLSCHILNCILRYIYYFCYLRAVKLCYIKIRLMTCSKQPFFPNHDIGNCALSLIDDWSNVMLLKFI